MIKRMRVGVVVLVLLQACSTNNPIPATPTASPTVPAVAIRPTPPRPTPSATAPPRPSPTVPPSPTAVPTPTMPPPSPTVVPPTATPDPVAGLSIPDLRLRQFGAGEITIGEVWNRADGYTSYRISYPLDELRLTGLLHLPDGAGPFPAIIANRGTIARDIYQPGMDSRAFSDLLARNGFLVVAPDFRGYAGGDDGPNQFYTGFYADVLGLIPLVQKLPQAQAGKIGMWGHSRGASATIAALTISDQIAAAVVYAPAPADLALDYERRKRNSGGDPGSATWPFTPAENPTAYERISPINYFDAVNAPVLLHHGTADTTVDYSASVAIADVLRAQGNDVTLHLYEGSGHALQGAAYDLYAERTLAFFRMELGE